MRARGHLLRLTAAFVTSCAMALSLSGTARAADNPTAPQITRAYNIWAVALADADCDGAEVADLYTRRAVLLATFTEYVAGRTAITKYFDDLTCKDNLTVSTQRITSVRDGSMGYATGLYTFAYNSIDGVRIEVPARFTFVFELRGGTWMIVNHHSSVNPELL